MLDSLVTIVFALGAVLCGAFYWFFTRQFDYWKKQGAPYEVPTPFIGNVKDLYFVRKSLGQFFADMYKRCGDLPFMGFYTLNEPAILIKDLEMTKHILIKDFQYFADHNFSCHEKTDPLFERSLFAAKGDKWKHIRRKLNPIFSSSKIKNMFNLVLECSEVLKSYVEKAAESGEPLEVKDATARFTTDVIAACAFGIECNALKEPDAEFRAKGREMFTFSSFRSVKMISAFMNPIIMRLIRWRIVNNDYYVFVRRAISSVMEQRTSNNWSRNDFIDLLLDVKEKSKGEAIRLEDEDYIAQAFVFLIAGSETSSTTMTFALYELALNSALQTKLRAEINTVLKEHDGKVTYEAIQDMPYLDMVVAETLRKYPLFPFLDRKCNADYKLPGTDVVVKRGMAVYMSILGIHHDPEFYSDPDKFDPERFNDTNKRTRPNMAYIPFGEGPRICIGVRFGLMNTKVGLIQVLANNRVTPCHQTPVPLVMDHRSFLLTTEGGISLSVSPVK